MLYMSKITFKKTNNLAVCLSQLYAISQKGHMELGQQFSLSALVSDLQPLSIARMGQNNSSTKCFGVRSRSLQAIKTPPAYCALDSLDCQC